MAPTRIVLLLASAVLARDVPAAPDFSRDILPILDANCLNCHDDVDEPKGGVNLERFRTEDDVLRSRRTWGAVFEKLESHQMPPPKRDAQPSPAEREQMLAWLRDLAGRPDPQLGVRDPGRPVLRRLTRLEYNNTVRDLFGLEGDLFTFPERVLFRDKDYFQPASGRMGDEVQAQLLEFGGRRATLLPAAGLPADNRAEHGYRNRGDAMNLSPLLLEQYVALAGEIVNHAELPRRSRIFAELLGVEFMPRPPPAEKSAPSAGSTSAVAEMFAPKVLQPAVASGSAITPAGFRAALAEAYRTGRGGVFGVSASAANTTIAGKGGLVRLPFGPTPAKILTINPNEDLWLVGFSTAEETSGDLLFTNKVKQAKRFELTFRIEGGEPNEGITQLALCVLGRARQTGEVTLIARFSDDTEQRLSASLAEGAAGTTYFAFAAHPGEIIKSLVVDGTKFGGDYVLLDDLGFITNGAVRRGEPPLVAAAAAVTPAKKSTALPATPPSAPRTSPALPARERLAQFLDRAFRRPSTPDERSRYLGLFDRARAEGKAEPAAMRVALQAILSSPTFLFLAEPVQPGAGPIRRLDDSEIAARLSYFLWSSAPDAELLAAASARQLGEPADVERQVRRMLRDSRGRELSESFAVQWLRLDQLYTAQPDRDLFKAFYSGPQGKDTLHAAMMLEALLLFETVMVEDRSILDFINADYTWLNPRLAKLYGDNALPSAVAANGAASANVVIAAQPNRELRQDDRNANNRWTRVALADRNRGGYMTMAGPLTVTSLPFRTSPVKRGAWLLETIFNRPPQEPKVAFAVSDDTKAAALAMSIRERFEAHRNKAECYSCHVRLDPPGFALERFDPIGRWRDTDGGVPVDASAEWNATPFDSPAGFKAAVMKNPEKFTRGFIEHLLAFALGRRLEFFDLPAVEEIQRHARADGYRFSSVVVRIATSYPFLHVRNQPVAPSVTSTHAR